MDNEILELVKAKIISVLKEQEVDIIEEPNGKKKGKSLIGLLNDADKNQIEREKVEVEKEKIEIERDKLEVEKEKIEIEREKTISDKETKTYQSKMDFLGKVVNGVLTLVGTIAGLIFVDRWTRWGFIQEEYGSIVGKTMANVMREWKFKRAS